MFFWCILLAHETYSHEWMYVNRPAFIIVKDSVIRNQMRQMWLLACLCLHIMLAYQLSPLHIPLWLFCSYVFPHVDLFSDQKRSNTAPSAFLRHSVTFELPYASTCQRREWSTQNECKTGEQSKVLPVNWEHKDVEGYTLFFLFFVLHRLFSKAPEVGEPSQQTQNLKLESEFFSCNIWIK